MESPWRARAKPPITADDSCRTGARPAVAAGIRRRAVFRWSREDAMEGYLWIAIGGALGSVARYWCSGIAARLIGETFPWGTLIVNVVGSFVIGFFATLTGPDGRLFVGTTARQFVMIGLCG